MPQTAAEQPEPVRVGRVPRISRLMALALRMEGLLRVRTVKDYAELARLGECRERASPSFLNLRNLAPTIQE